MSTEDKTELIIAVRNYRFQKRRDDLSVDFSLLDSASNEKILLRSMEPQAKTNFVGISEVRKLLRHEAPEF